MRTTMLAAAVVLLFALPTTSHAELMCVVAVAGFNQVMFAAYEDNQVRVSGGPPHQLTDINRDAPIRRMQAFGTAVGGFLILYADGPSVPGGHVLWVPVLPRRPS